MNKAFECDIGFNEANMLIFIDLFIFIFNYLYFIIIFYLIWSLSPFPLVLLKITKSYSCYN
jgi:hypothetical protein